MPSAHVSLVAAAVFKRACNTVYIYIILLPVTAYYNIIYVQISTCVYFNRSYIHCTARRTRVITYRGIYPPVVYTHIWLLYDIISLPLALKTVRYNRPPRS